MKAKNKPFIRAPKKISEISLYKEIKDLVLQISAWYPDMRSDCKTFATKCIDCCVSALVLFRKTYKTKELTSKIEFCDQCEAEVFQNTKLIRKS